METMSRRDYAEVGLVDGVCRKIAMVVGEMWEARGSGLKRKFVFREPATGDTN